MTDADLRLAINWMLKDSLAGNEQAKEAQNWWYYDPVPIGINAGLISMRNLLEKVDTPYVRDLKVRLIVHKLEQS